MDSRLAKAASRRVASCTLRNVQPVTVNEVLKALLLAWWSDGFIGWDDLLRPIRIAKYPLLVQSVGARWPYATTLFDYIRRAMPSYAPKSLKSDEVYALTAFLLNLNGLVDEAAVMNAHSLPKIAMPAAAKSVMGE
ncbi:MAG: hypothetical protein U1D25_19685 [Hydrogenophaga sp.]|uniref:c-type cytochrome n=1 Tax=Hydrogenophaga sp. TaxID=1904254 RepID=UPI0027797C34|nr:hypothetical protein [Hydrogenophaga sp.]MDP2417772.1 hypothetical protein [Hydrogenophaga sp.]MDZ4190312.1 hypothetical protein [Hydrogenophaga sp.]